MDGELNEEKLASFVHNRHRNFSVIFGLSQYRYLGVMATDKIFNSSKDQKILCIGCKKSSNLGTKLWLLFVGLR